MRGPVQTIAGSIHIGLLSIPNRDSVHTVPIEYSTLFIGFCEAQSLSFQSDA